MAHDRLTAGGKSLAVLSTFGRDHAQRPSPRSPGVPGSR